MYLFILNDRDYFFLVSSFLFLFCLLSSCLPVRASTCTSFCVHTQARVCVWT
uniref:Uncharacterized protein n=1 Tax=Rhizophora mucronata TaxID=61149 RepID=A0A2P2QUC6_RHIMU